ncbi:MAG: DUF1073 domain-containing protein [Candidatus Bathyarchaeota archaeon]|nr:DUF1073 domain-containing protein [Candidatus Bathyarchaeota archaeon]
MQFGSDRNIDISLGYKAKPEIRDFLSYYDRRGLAATIVDAPAKTTWRKTPIVTDETEGKSDFSKEWAKLSDNLNVYHYLERVDRLSGIGRYGVLLIGAKDDKLLSEELKVVTGPEQVIFLSAFGEQHVGIKKFEDDEHNPRFGHPLEYEIDLMGNLASGKGLNKQRVHWSRVIHIAEGLLTDEVFGEPRLQKVFDRLFDLDKIVGSSAEGHWQTAVPGFALGAEKEFADMSDDDLKAMKEEWQNYIHGLQRLVSIKGGKFAPIKGEIADPTAAFSVVIQLISGKTGIPQRILLGSERGNLASTQDQANWLGRIAERQLQFAEPRILRPLIDRLREIGALSAPDGGTYKVEWPGLFYLTDEEQAEVYLKRANAVKAITGGFPEDIFTKPELRVMLGASPEPDKEEITTHELDESDKEVIAEFEQLSTTD